MIDHCPHCGRAVASDEELVSTRIGYVPTSCASGDGPLADYRTAERVKNHPHWYCSVLDTDTGRRGMVTGPHATYDDAQADLPRAKRLAAELNSWAAFMAYGVASSTNRLNSVEGRHAADRANGG